MAGNVAARHIRFAPQDLPVTAGELHATFQHFAILLELCSGCRGLGDSVAHDGLPR